MDFGNLLQYSCLENRKDRGTWQAKIYGVARVGHDLATRERQTDRQTDTQTDMDFQAVIRKEKEDGP